MDGREWASSIYSNDRKIYDPDRRIPGTDIARIRGGEWDEVAQAAADIWLLD